MISYEYIEASIMGAAQEAIDYAKTTYDKLYTWQPVFTTLRFDGEVWKEVGAPGNAMWRWYGNPNDKYVFDPSKKSRLTFGMPKPELRIGDMWMETK
jgi:hypothetical protein